MNNKVTFGRWETITVLLNSMGIPILLGFPRGMVELGGTAGWLICIYITVLALALFYIISRLYKPFEGMDPLDLGERIAGNAGRIIVGLIFFTHSTFIVSMILREFGEDMKVIALTVSPISFVQLFFITGMIVGAYKGIEAVVRMHSVVVVLISAGVLILVIFVMPFFKFGNIYPILGNGPEKIFGTGFFRVSSFSALIIIYMVFPFIKSHEQFRTAGFWGIGLTGFFMTLVTLTFIGVLPYPISLEQFLPVYQLSRIINVGRFFERIESVFMLLWASAALLYLSFAFIIILRIFQKAFKLPYYRPLILPFAVILFTLSLLPPNVMTALNLEAIFFRSYAWLTTFLFMIILLITARFVSKKEKGRIKT
ncbi:MAG: spore germination protein [Clostridia bacterium]|nr:spore germination protein [Clostridia bacterium]